MSISPSAGWQRTTHRAIRHHLVLALASALGLLLVYQVLALQADDVVFLWSMATAYVAAALLAATLWTGPVNVLLGRRNPVSTDLRRDLGIWAGLIGLAHVGVGSQVHFRGRMWFYFVREVEETTKLVLRSDLFGFANYTGALATLVLALLLALSNDLSLRRLKAVRWKALQRWNYALFGLVVIHGIAYQIIEKRKVPYVLLFAVLATVTVAVQLAGFVERRKLAAARLRPAHERKAAAWPEPSPGDQ